MRRLLSGVPASSAFAASSTPTFHPRLRFARAKSRSTTAAGPACFIAAASSSSASAADGDASGAQRSWMLVRLVNTERMYKRTRHNVGFEIINASAEAEDISVSNMQFKAMIRKGIGRPTGKIDAISFVLRSFTKEGQGEISNCLYMFYA